MTLPIPNIWELHPMLVHFPIALLLTGVVMECLARKRPTLTRPASGILVAGVALGWLSAAAGLLSFYTVPAHTEQAHTLMWWHLGFAVFALLFFSGVAVKRWRGRQAAVTKPVLLIELCGAILLIITAYLGGTIVYHGGAGVEPELLSQEVRSEHHHGDAGHGASSETHSESSHEHTEGEDQHEH